MTTDRDNLTAQQRAAKLKWHLDVRTNVKGEPVWRVKWYDSTKTEKMRALGQRGQVAKLWPTQWAIDSANPFIDPEKLRPHDPQIRGWRRNWETARRGRTARPDDAVTYEEARELAKAVVRKRELEIDAERAEEAEQRGEGPVTFARVAHDFLLGCERRVKKNGLKIGTLNRYRSALREPTSNPQPGEGLIFLALGETPIADLTMKHVKQFLEAQVDEGKATQTLRLYRAAISGVLRTAVEQELITRNVTLDLPRGFLPNKQRGEDDTRFYEPDQVEQIALLCTDERIGDMIRLGRYTGARQAELAALRWRDVDTENGLLHIRATMVTSEPGTENLPKAGKVRSVPLSEKALITLMRRKDRAQFIGPNDRIFATRTGNYIGPSRIRDKWNAARDLWIAIEVEAGRPEPPALTFHSTRNTFGVELARGGIAGVTIQGAMGHNDYSMTNHYLSYSPRHSDADDFTRAQGGTVEKIQRATPVRT